MKLPFDHSPVVIHRSSISLGHCRLFPSARRSDQWDLFIGGWVWASGNERAKGKAKPPRSRVSQSQGGCFLLALVHTVHLCCIGSDVWWFCCAERGSSETR
ncbi:hypothetical protein N657DRAFT_481463 [Parathielavia appendiculata]|uniref:Uncharacterized protein n=1 Tax=Parathielavia appendiculata TaxID=2587402 RepID=A0AAN6TY18_9PEZI|nr:hypothetical protein N657DRAFT_481463 [Parathielavia appendiculata]